GTGATATSTSRVSVYYAGYFPDGTLFDSRSSPSSPFGPFQLGANAVIKGWEEGLVGMKAGGTRQLIIPPSLAYGASGYGAIPPNAVLVFNVQLVAVQ
ncbi:MAG TPA: FKBP-type peptidyl-prolyl cis-trans isomerase, partial [Gemmatimonadaceae bacterium]|nr:FKBP-type peptidyl-prolyl cis-trans isomerase [Gemmatimonadaceae bacterium]